MITGGIAQDLSLLIDVIEVVVIASETGATPKKTSETEALEVENKTEITTKVEMSVHKAETIVKKIEYKDQENLK